MRERNSAAVCRLQTKYNTKWLSEARQSQNIGVHILMHILMPTLSVKIG
jgi:hypothetical protein